MAERFQTLSLCFLISLSLAAVVAAIAVNSAPSIPESKPRTIKTGDSPHALAFSPDGKILAVGFENRISLFDAKTGKILRNIDGDVDYEWFTFDKDGRQLLSGGSFWDVASGKKLRSVADCVEAVLSPDGKMMAGSQQSERVKVWDLASGKEICKIQQKLVESIAFSKDGTCFFTGDFDGSIKSWELPGGRPLRTLRTFKKDPGGFDNPVVSIFLTPDGKTLVDGSERDLVFFDVATGKMLKKVSSNEPAFDSVVASPDGRTVAAGCFHNIIYYDGSSGARLRSHFAHTGDNISLAFSPDGSILASCSDEMIKLWDATWTKGANHAELAPKLQPVPKGASRLEESEGVKIGNMKYVLAETRRDPLLEKAIHSIGEFHSGDGEEWTVKYAYGKSDLNGDGKPEALVYVYGPMICGSGGCSILIASPTGAGYKIVGSTNLVSTPIIVTDQTTRGWRNLVFCSREGFRKTSWNGKKYTERQWPRDKLKPGETISGTALLADDDLYKKGFKI
jgi:WD40 repeat protein